MFSEITIKRFFKLIDFTLLEQKYLLGGKGAFLMNLDKLNVGNNDHLFQQGLPNEQRFVLAILPVFLLLQTWTNHSIQCSLGC